MQTDSQAITCVISQPMYFPWPGMLEQIRLCDTFIYYDDVQYSKGSFTNRVQIKTEYGIRWLTVPLFKLQLGQKINEVKINNEIEWKRSQLDQLRQAYAKAPFRNEMLDLVSKVFSKKYDTIGELALSSTEALIRYFPSLIKRTIILKSSTLNIVGNKTQRVVDLCTALNTRIYLTGHGARHYLEHERFETRGINVAYINYSLSEYPQSHGTFTPYVSSLDLIANCGPNGVQHIKGQLIPWRKFLEDCQNNNHEERS